MKTLINQATVRVTANKNLMFHAQITQKAGVLDVDSSIRVGADNERFVFDALLACLWNHTDDDDIRMCALLMSAMQIRGLSVAGEEHGPLAIPEPPAHYEDDDIPF